VKHKISGNNPSLPFKKTRNKISSDVSKKYSSFKDIKNITEDLFKESSKLLKTLILQENHHKDDIFYGFEINDNKLILPSAAYLLSKSYKFSKEKHTNNNFIQKKNFNDEKILAQYAKVIYSKTETKQTRGLIKLFEEQHPLDKESGEGTKLLTPVYAIFKNDDTKSIILAIRGTATTKDVLIDGLATTKSIILDDNEYYAHAGFLQASSHIADKTASQLTKLLTDNPGYKLTVTGHSLGGGTATITGIMLFENYFKRNRAVNICGFASGASFAAQKNGKALEQYLIKYPVLTISTFVYENDIVPRLSAFELFTFLATCVSICKLIFLQKNLTLFPGFNLSQDHRDKFLNKNTIIRNAIASSNFFREAYRRNKRIKKKLIGGDEDVEENIRADEDVVIIKCCNIYETIYSVFEEKFKQNGEFYKIFTSHPGVVYHMSDGNITEIDPYMLKAKFETESLKNHLMKNYIDALDISHKFTQTSGKRKKTRRRKTRKTRRKIKSRQRRKYN
jgi:hypothetical protein